MKKFTVKLILFCLLFSLLLAGISLLFHNNTLKNDIFHQHILHFNKYNKSISILIVGDSHPAFGIDNNLLPDHIYNFSCFGENLKATYLKIKYATKKHPSITTIVLPIDYHLITDFQTILTKRSLYRIQAYAEKKDINKLFDITLFEYFIYKMSYLFPLLNNENREKFAKYAFRKILFTDESEEPISIDKTGNTHYTKLIEWSNLSQKKRDNETFKFAIKKHRLDTINKHYIESYKKILKFCHHNNLKVIGVAYPLTKEYIELAQKYNGDKINSIFNNMNLDRTLYFRNKFISNPVYFRNQDHLNTNGAKIFTKILVKDLEKIINP